MKHISIIISVHVQYSLPIKAVFFNNTYVFGSIATFIIRYYILQYALSDYAF
jgi:hypothetical protein